jgi:hypothetical protein
MDIIEIIAIGMITLAGVVVGAVLNNWFSEKGWRKERQDLAQEGLLNALNDFYLDLTNVHYCVLHSREISDYGEEIRTYKRLVGAEGKLTKSGRDLFKAYSILRRYTKSPIFSWDELDNERRKLEKLMGEACEHFTKLKNEKLNKELDSQIKKIYEVIGRVSSKFVNA